MTTLSVAAQERFRQNNSDDWQASSAKLELRPIRDPYTWAEQERWIAKGASPLSMHGDIRWRGDVFPWCRDMMRDCIDPAVQVNVWWLASGMGKTETAGTVIGWAMSESPQNIMVVYPKKESVIKFSRDVLQRSIIDATPCVRAKVAAKKSRDSANTLEFKSYEGGSIYVVGAGSASNFRGPRASLVYADEVDNYPILPEGEGDQVLLLHRRCEGFAKAIKIVSGTATLCKQPVSENVWHYRSRIEEWYDKSDKTQWVGACPYCGEYQLPIKEQIVAPIGSEHLAQYRCIHCEELWSDAQRLEAARGGHFKPYADFTGVRARRVSGIWSTLPAEKGYASKLHQILKNWRDSKDYPEKRKVFINTVDNDVYDDAEESANMEAYVKVLHAGRENYAVPKDVRLINATADLQIDRIEVEWLGWGLNEESWGLEKVIIEGSIHDPDIFKRLIKQLERVWIRDDMAKLRLGLAFIDAGKWGDKVYSLIREIALQKSPIDGRVRACRGASVYPHPIVARDFAKLDKNLMGHWVGGDAAKELLYARLRAGMDTPNGRCHFPMSYDESHFVQLCSESLTTVKRDGFVQQRFTKPEGKANEALDLRVYHLAAYAARDWNMDQLEAENLATLQPVSPAAKKPGGVFGRSNGIPGGW